MAPRDPQESLHLQAAGRRCVLLHGFTGTPAEMQYLANRLWEAGFDVTVPCLPGHGAQEGLVQVGSAEWLAAARHVISEASDRGPICLAGLSMGALLATVLAAELPGKVAALALLAPAVRLTGAAQTAASWFQRPWLRRLVPFLPKYGGSDIRDEAAKAVSTTGAKVSTYGLAELGPLGARALEAAAGIRCPTLMLLGGLDHTIDNAAARRLAERIGRLTGVRSFPRSGHQLGLDFERQEVADALLDLFRQTVDSHGKPTEEVGG